MSIEGDARRTVRAGAALSGVLLGLLVGCTSQPDSTMGPSATTDPPSPAAPSFPELSRTGEIYVGNDNASRYVFYSDDSFELQYSGGSIKYPGRTTRTGSRIIFHWDGRSTAGRWEATGTLQGDSLRVEYNLIMQLSDFEDGVYLKASRTP